MKQYHIPFIETGPVHSPGEIREVLALSVNDTMTVGNNKGIYYYNVPCSFDIETTSFYVDDAGQVLTWEQKAERQKLDSNFNPDKRAVMYCWTFGINGVIVMGRTWEEFFSMLDEVSKILHLDNERRLMVYVHNLEFEFQFICKWLEWEKVFSIEERKPLYALTKTGIEFRCSYRLSGYGLDSLGKNLLKYKVQKLTGNLDYSLLRHSQTPLTQSEIDYCVNDVRVVMAYIQEQIELTGHITDIPLTKTGRVRNYCRSNTLRLPGSHKRNKRYFDLIHQLTIGDLNEFELLHRAFQGGFTHANAYFSGAICYNVASYDFTSSYPYVMVSEKFPMSQAVKVDLKSVEDFKRYMDIDNYLCVFDICFHKIYSVDANEHYISLEKCRGVVNEVTDNGRIVSADLLATTITNIDYILIRNYYNYAEIEIKNFYVYPCCDYLPTEFVKCVLELYGRKATLKGVNGREQEYTQAKEMINSCYGMCVTNPLRDEYLFSRESGWETYEPNPPELMEMLYQHNIGTNRFLYYSWGVFITAYARYNLFTGIRHFGDDYIYSDTDSIKVLNYQDGEHQRYIRNYNALVEKKLKRAMERHNLPFDLVQPSTIEGEVKMLGVWDFEGVYTRFKTLGAKRYMVERDGALTAGGKTYPISITVSGVDKRAAVPYIYDRLSKGDATMAFTSFEDGLHIPPGETGKMLHTYIDVEQSGYMTDYQGNTAFYSEKSSLHLEPTGYDLGIAAMYAAFLKGIRMEVE